MPKASSGQWQQLMSYSGPPHLLPPLRCLTPPLCFYLLVRRAPLYVPQHYRKTTPHPDIVPGAGWKAMDDMENSWRSRALKIEHSTVPVYLFLTLVKLYQHVFFSRPIAASAGLAFLVMHSAFRCSRRHRLHKLVHFSPWSDKCKLSPTSVPSVRHASNFGSQM